MLRITAELRQSTAEESAEKGLSATRYAATVNAHAREEARFRYRFTRRIGF
jgi:hypothetical protein